MTKGKRHTKSLVAYARHRGVTPAAVTKAIATGRLHASVSRDADSKPSIPDVTAADREWETNTRPKLDAPAGARISAEAAAYRALRESTAARKELANAQIAEMRLAELRAGLVSAKEVEERAVQMFARCRARILSIPARARQRDPSLAASHLALLEALLLEALEDLTAEAAIAVLRDLGRRRR